MASARFAHACHGHGKIPCRAAEIHGLMGISCSLLENCCFLMRIFGEKSVMFRVGKISVCQVCHGKKTIHGVFLEGVKFFQCRVFLLEGTRVLTSSIRLHRNMFHGTFPILVAFQPPPGTSWCFKSRHFRPINPYIYIMYVCVSYIYIENTHKKIL